MSTVICKCPRHVEEELVVNRFELYKVAFEIPKCPKCNRVMDVLPAEWDSFYHTWCTWKSSNLQQHILENKRERKRQRKELRKLSILNLKKPRKVKV